MASSRQSRGAALAVVVVVVLALVQTTTAMNYFVGGPLEWQLNRYGDPNFYQGWANSNFPYRTTDTLEFRWSQGDSVLQVNEADFNTCNVMHPIGFWMNEGRLVFSLAGYQNRRVFFISGAMDHCGKGQKFFIEVYPAA